jgi:hypothetical protein
MHRHDLPPVDHLLDIPGVLGRITGLIVVEVTIDLLPLACPGGEGPRPFGKNLGGILTLIGTTGTVEPDIDKIRSDLFGRNLTPNS